MAAVAALITLSCSAQSVIEQETIALLERYNRPFTVWHNGDDIQLAQALLRRFNDMVSIVSTMCPEMLISQEWPNLIILDQHVTLDHWEMVTGAEHVDLLMLSLDGHAEWKQYLEQGRMMADHTLFWVHKPNCTMRAQLDKFLHVTWLCRDIHLFAGVLTTQNHYLRRKLCLYGMNIHEGTLHHDRYRVASDFQSKYFMKWRPNRLFKTVWEPGINLITYKLCKGVYPNVAQIMQAIIDKQSTIHDDWGAHNIILQGKKIALIDDNDPAHHMPRRRACMEQDFDRIYAFLMS